MDVVLKICLIVIIICIILLTLLLLYSQNYYHRVQKIALKKEDERTEKEKELLRKIQTEQAKINESREAKERNDKFELANQMLRSGEIDFLTYDTIRAQIFGEESLIEKIGLSAAIETGKYADSNIKKTTTLNPTPNPTSNPTKTIVKDAVIGGVIAGQTGAVVGAIVGKSKVDAGKK